MRNQDSMLIDVLAPPLKNDGSKIERLINHVNHEVSSNI